MWLLETMLINSKTDFKNHGDLRVIVNYIHKHILECLFPIAKKFGQTLGKLTEKQTLFKVLCPRQKDHVNLLFCRSLLLCLQSMVCGPMTCVFLWPFFNKCRSLGPTSGLQSQNLHWSKTSGLRTSVIAKVGMPGQRALFLIPKGICICASTWWYVLVHNFIAVYVPGFFLHCTIYFSFPLMVCNNNLI